MLQTFIVTDACAGKLLALLLMLIGETTFLVLQLDVVVAGTFELLQFLDLLIPILAFLTRIDRFIVNLRNQHLLRFIRSFFIIIII